jgi:hypothetical protein
MPGNDAVEDGAVVEAGPDILQKVFHGHRRLVRIQLDFERAHIGDHAHDGMGFAPGLGVGERQRHGCGG